MLQTQAVEPSTLSLLKKLMAMPGLEPFSLVGGTALALKFGHRKSIDLDLFSNQDFDNDSTTGILKANYSRYILEGAIEKVGVFCYIDNIKVNFIKHPHPLISKTEVIDNIRFFACRI